MTLEPKQSKGSRVTQTEEGEYTKDESDAKARKSGEIDATRLKRPNHWRTTSRVSSKNGVEQVHMEGEKGEQSALGIREKTKARALRP